MIKTGRFIVKRTLRNGGGHNFILKCALLLVCSLLSMALFSCAGGAGGGGSEADGTSLAIRADSAKTAYAREDIVSFSVTISSGSFTSTKTANKGETMLFSNLPVGNYSVKAYGKTSRGAVAAKCETSVTIVAGETTTTTLRLQRLDWYTVTFKDDNEAHTVLSSVQVTTGYPVTAPSDPASTEGHTFAYWGTTANATTSFDFNTPITSDIDLYAVYNITKYTVTFDYNGGKVGDATSTTQQVRLGYSPTAVTDPEWEDPVKGSYTFLGWATTADATTATGISSSITADTTYYAVWKPKYAITFDYNGGTDTSSASSKVVYVDEGTTITTPTEPRREDSVKGIYAFLGWATTADATTATGLGGSITADTTFYAVWKPKYAITFDYKGGTSTASSNVVYIDKDEDIPAPAVAPTKTGYKFMGWTTDSGATSASYGTAFTTVGIAFSDKTLYAVWKAACSVTYESEPVPITDASSLSFTDDAGLSSLPNPSTTGLTFGGWYTDAAFTEGNKVTSIPIGSITAGTISTTGGGSVSIASGSLTLYGKWTATVTVDSSIASSYDNATQTVLYNGTAIMPTLNYNPSNTTGGDRDLRPVEEWYKDNDIDSILTGGYDFSTPVTSGFTLRRGKYVKVYCYQIAPGSTDYSSATLIGGEPVKIKQNDSLSASDLPTPVAPDGYVLDGWDDVYIPSNPMASTSVTPYNSFGSQLDRGVKLYTRWRTAP